MRPFGIGGQLNRHAAIFNRLDHRLEFRARALGERAVVRLRRVRIDPRLAQILELCLLRRVDTGQSVRRHFVDNGLRRLQQVRTIAVQRLAHEIISERNAVSARVFLFGSLLHFLHRREQDMRGLVFLGRGILRSGGVHHGIGRLGARFFRVLDELRDGPPNQGYMRKLTKAEGGAADARHALSGFSNADANLPTLSSVGESLRRRQLRTHIVQRRGESGPQGEGVPDTTTNVRELCFLVKCS